MASFSKSESKYKIRSISFPCRSHPSTSTIEEELNKIKLREASSTVPSSKHILNDLSSLKGLYKSMDDLLNLQTTKLAFSQHQCTRFVDDLHEDFMSLLDIIGTSMEIMSQLKEHGRDIHSSLRRRKGDSNIGIIFTKITCFRKKMKKEAKKFLSTSKEIDEKFSTSMIMEIDHHVSSVIRSLREVVAISIVVINSLYSFLCPPISKQKSKWFMVLKLLHNGTAVACENQVEDLSELRYVDIALDQLCKSDLRKLVHDYDMKVAKNSLKTLELSIGDIENELMCLFRGMIRAKASLLNISSSFI